MKRLLMILLTTLLLKEFCIWNDGAANAMEVKVYLRNWWDKDGSGDLKTILKGVKGSKKVHELVEELKSNKELEGINFVGCVIYALKADLSIPVSNAISLHDKSRKDEKLEDVLKDGHTHVMIATEPKRKEWTGEGKEKFIRVYVRKWKWELPKGTWNFFDKSTGEHDDPITSIANLKPTDSVKMLWEKLKGAISTRMMALEPKRYEAIEKMGSPLYPFLDNVYAGKVVDQGPGGPHRIFPNPSRLLYSYPEDTPLSHVLGDDHYCILLISNELSNALDFGHLF